MERGAGIEEEGALIQLVDSREALVERVVGVGGVGVGFKGQDLGAVWVGVGVGEVEGGADDAVGVAEELI